MRAFRPKPFRADADATRSDGLTAEQHKAMLAEFDRRLASFKETWRVCRNGNCRRGRECLAALAPRNDVVALVDLCRRRRNNALGLKPRHLKNKVERRQLMLPGDLGETSGQFGDVFGGQRPLAIRSVGSARRRRGCIHWPWPSRTFGCPCTQYIVAGIMVVNSLKDCIENRLLTPEIPPLIPAAGTFTI